MAGAAAAVGSATSSVTPVVVSVCLAIAPRECAAASVGHLRLVTLRRLLEFVHPRRSLLHLARLDEALQRGGQLLLVGHGELGGVVGFQVLPDLGQAHALALLEVEHGVPQHGRHLHCRSGFHCHRNGLHEDDHQSHRLWCVTTRILHAAK